jgi:ATP synthase protein I
MQDKKDDWPAQFARYSSLGIQMVVIILLGVYAGYKIDQWLGMHKHIFMLILSIASVFLALYYAFKDLMKFK